MTQYHSSDSFHELSNIESPLKHAEAIQDSQSQPLLVDQSTLLETEVIRMELYAEMPLIKRHTVVRENMSVSQALAQETTH